MKPLFFRLLICSLLVSGGCALFRRPVVVQEYDKIPNTRNVNVCKYLTDTVVVYAVFVNTAIYQPWTSFDISSTEDSLRKSCDWLEAEAAKRGVKLTFLCVSHKQGGKDLIVEKRAHAKLSGNVVSGVNTYGRGAWAFAWSDAISKYAGKTVKQKATDRIKISSVLTLNHALRNYYSRENVAILFFVNGYIQQDPSFSYNIESNRFAEHCIVTTKNPAMIAHELLHLFGGVDLYPNYNFPNFNYKELSEKYPDEVMRIQHKRIEKLSISPITEYFIGWQDTLSHADTRILLHKHALTDY